MGQKELGHPVGMSGESVNRQVRLRGETGIIEYVHGSLIVNKTGAFSQGFGDMMKAPPE